MKLNWVWSIHRIHRKQGINHIVKEILCKQRKKHYCFLLVIQLRSFLSHTGNCSTNTTVFYNRSNRLLLYTRIGASDKVNCTRQVSREFRDTMDQSVAMIFEWNLSVTEMHHEILSNSSRAMICTSLGFPFILCLATEFTDMSVCLFLLFVCLFICLWKDIIST